MEQDYQHEGNTKTTSVLGEKGAYNLSSAASITAVIAASSSCTPMEAHDFEPKSVTTDSLEGTEHPSVTFRLQLITCIHGHHFLPCMFCLRSMCCCKICLDREGLKETTIFFKEAEKTCKIRETENYFAGFIVNSNFSDLSTCLSKWNR